MRCRVDRCRVSTEAATRDVVVNHSLRIREAKERRKHAHLAAHRRNAFPAVLVDDLVRVSRGDFNVGSHNHDSFRPVKKATVSQISGASKVSDEESRS